MRQCIDGLLRKRPPELSYKRMTMKAHGLIWLFAFGMVTAEIPASAGSGKPQAA